LPAYKTGVILYPVFQAEPDIERLYGIAQVLHVRDPVFLADAFGFQQAYHLFGSKTIQRVKIHQSHQCPGNGILLVLGFTGNKERNGIWTIAKNCFHIRGIGVHIGQEHQHIFGLKPRTGMHEGEQIIVKHLHFTNRCVTGIDHQCSIPCVFFRQCTRLRDKVPAQGVPELAQKRFTGVLSPQGHHFTFPGQHGRHLGILSSQRSAQRVGKIPFFKEMFRGENQVIRHVNDAGQFF